MVKSNIKCPLCGESMEIIPQMSEKWNKIYCPRQTCGLRCFIKDISKLTTKKDSFSQTDEALLLRRLEIKKLREHIKQLTNALECIKADKEDVLRRAARRAAKFIYDICETGAIHQPCGHLYQDINHKDCDCCEEGLFVPAYIITTTQLDKLINTILEETQ